MGTINKPHTFVGDTKAKASEVNATFDEIYNEFNGNIDENNINFSKAELNKIIYPIGSIYFNAGTSENPSTLLGFGTWERFGEGKVLVGVDSTDTDFDTAEKTGGEKTHTLTDAEMPSHNHGGSTSTDGNHNHSYYNFNSGNGENVGTENTSYYAGTNTTGTAGSHNHSISTSGSDNAHNNLQPYITVYMWKRTA
jgi:hypothetical protein